MIDRAPAAHESLPPVAARHRVLPPLVGDLRLAEMIRDDTPSDRTPRVSRNMVVLAVSSGGENWSQLELLAPAFAPARVVYAAALTSADVTVDPGGDGEIVPLEEFSLYRPGRLWTAAVRLLALLRRQRFDLIVTTGAAPGLLAVALGRLWGVRSIWIESIVNTDEISLSGRLAGYFVDQWLVQWPHLERPGGPHFRGSVL